MLAPSWQFTRLWLQDIILCYSKLATMQRSQAIALRLWVTDWGNGVFSLRQWVEDWCTHLSRQFRQKTPTSLKKNQPLNVPNFQCFWSERLIARHLLHSSWQFQWRQRQNLDLTPVCTDKDHCFIFYVHKRMAFGMTHMGKYFRYLSADFGQSQLTCATLSTPIDSAILRVSEPLATWPQRAR